MCLSGEIWGAGDSTKKTRKKVDTGGAGENGEIGICSASGSDFSVNVVAKVNMVP